VGASVCTPLNNLAYSKSPRERTVPIKPPRAGAGCPWRSFQGRSTAMRGATYAGHTGCSSRRRVRRIAGGGTRCVELSTRICPSVVNTKFEPSELKLFCSSKSRYRYFLSGGSQFVSRKESESLVHTLSVSDSANDSMRSSISPVTTLDRVERPQGTFERRVISSRIRRPTSR